MHHGPNLPNLHPLGSKLMPFEVLQVTKTLWAQGCQSDWVWPLFPEDTPLLLLDL